MYCKNCGKKLSKDAKFCRECGTKTEVKTTIEISDNIPVNKSKAVASLVLGIISFFIGFFLIPLPIIGLILGICQKGKSGEKTAGIVLNAFSIASTILLWMFIIFLVAVDQGVKNYESIEDNRGNSDIIINDEIFE